MIELKDLGLEGKKDMLVHHTSICLVKTNRGVSGLNWKNCVLLESKSKVHTFCNCNLLQNILAQEEVMTLAGNGGTMTTSQMTNIENLDAKDTV